MRIAASVLDCKDRIRGVLELNRTNISYVHIDVMDGKFVPNIQFDNMDEIRNISSVTKYPMDVHLMVDNPSSYINELGNMNIEFITIHLEIDKDIREIFKSIRELGYKVGLSIKPNTSIKDIEPYLDDIDMVLVMSVEPGLGGQTFLESTIDRIIKLKELIGNRNILIEVDGGINKDNIAKLDNVDIAVVGSYITKSDNYKNSVDELLNINCNSKESVYKILLRIGIFPFGLLLIAAICNSIFGGSAFGSVIYGFDAFYLTIIAYSFIYWPILLIGLILIIVSVINLNKLKRLS